YDAVDSSGDAMKRANSTDPAKVLAAMPATDYKGVSGETSCTPQGDLKHGAISVFTYKSGKKALLDIVQM
ncbi:ethanolamine utilization protein EutJ, partial [Clostridioides difficile]|nr:ethanolamine utilization protein EutJ [Clostridioides difficile]